MMKAFHSRTLLLAVLMAVLLLPLSSCVTFEVGILHTPTPNARLTATVQALQTSNAALADLIANPPATITPGIPGEETPGPTPAPTSTPSGPRFSALRFSTNSDAHAPQRFYAAGVPQIFAVWDYANMREGMVIRRVWTLNGVTWIEREDTWDLFTYGSSGTMHDVSIFDDNIGLQAGEYSLSLYIDGIRQPMGETSETSIFYIFPPEIREPVLSPDQQMNAFVLNGGRLFVGLANGASRELASTEEISSIAWFPDSRNLLYAERDRSMQVAPSEDWGITHKLWIVNVDSGERHLLSTSGENFHHPQISPNGRFIAVLVGNTFGEGCFYSPSLVILELNEELRRENVLKIEDFEGVPYLEQVRGGIYPVDHTMPGSWEGDDKLLVSLWWLCLDSPDNPDGTYLFDLSTRRAQRTGTQP